MPPTTTRLGFLEMHTGWKIKVHLEGKHNRIDERGALKTTDVLMLFNVLVH